MAAFTGGAGRRKRILKRLRQQCADQLEGLDLPVPCDIALLCEHLGERRGRPIHLLPLPLPMSHACGVSAATPAADYIFYEPDTSRPHQEHIIAHELGHLLCAHHSDRELSDADARHLFPDIDPALVRDMLGRADYADAMEQEAEMMAYLIRAAVGNIGALPSPGMLGAFEAAMGYRYRPLR